MKKAILFICFLFVCSISFAQIIPVNLPTIVTPDETVYIATNGNDTNSGTYLQPKKTFKSALAQISFGTAGTNGGNNYGEVVILSGHYYPKSNEFAQYESQWRKSISGNWVYKNVSIRGIGEVVIHGDSLGTGSQMIYLRGSNIQIRNLTIQNCPLHGISLSGSEITPHSDVLIDSVTVDSAMGFGMLIKGYSRVQVEHSVVSNTCRSNERELDGKCQWASGLRTDNCNNVTIRYCQVNNNWGEGINTSLSRTIEVANNVIFNNYSGNIYCHSASRGVYRNNLIYNNDSTYWRHCSGKEGKSSDGISLANELVCTNACPLYTNNCGTKKACCNYTDYNNSVGVNVDYYQIDSIFVLNNIMLDVGMSVWDAFSGFANYSFIKNVFIENNTIIGVYGTPTAKKAALNIFLGTSYVDFNNINIRNNIFSIDYDQPNSNTFTAYAPNGICTGTWSNRVHFSNNLWNKLPTVSGVDFSADSVSTNLPVQVNFSELDQLKPTLFRPELRWEVPKISYISNDYFDSIRLSMTNVGAIEYSPDSIANDTSCWQLISASNTINQTVCILNPIDSISYSYSNTYTVSPTIVGLPSGVTSSISGDGKFFISGTPTTAGVFNYTISTNTSCTDSIINGSIEALASPTAIISGDTSICTGNTGVLSIRLTGMAPWNFSYGSSVDTNSVTGFYADTYTVSTSSGVYTVTTVSDSTGCVGAGSDSAQISEYTPLEVKNVISTCNTSSSKYIVVFDLAGGDSTTYKLIQGTGIFTNKKFTSDSIPSGTAYQFVVADNNSCDSVNVNGLGNCNCNASAEITGGKNICANDTALITINLFGTPPFDFTVALDNVDQSPVSGINTSSYTFTTTATGAYSLSAFNDSICSGSINGSATITKNTPLATISGGGPICVGDSVDLIFELTVGTPPWSFSYSDGSINSALISSSELSKTISVSTAGNYTLVQVENGSCSGMGSGNVTVQINALPVVGSTVSPALTICSGSAVTLNGTGATTYVWSDGFIDGEAKTISSSKTLIMNGTDGNGCSNKDTIHLTVLDLPLLGSIAVPSSAAVCDGESVLLNGTGAESYSWSGGIFDGVSFIPDATKTYTITGVDSNNCSNTAIRVVTVLPLPTVGILVTPNDTICNGNDVTLAGTGAKTYLWSGGISNDLAFSPAASGTYTVVGSDNYSCKSQASQEITVEDCGVGVNINGSQTTQQNMLVYPNPTTGIILVEIKNAQFDILTFIVRDMLGQVVYSQTEKSIPPDSHYKMNLDFLPNGMYYLNCIADDNLQNWKIIKQ